MKPSLTRLTRLTRRQLLNSFASVRRICGPWAEIEVIGMVKGTEHLIVKVLQTTSGVFVYPLRKDFKVFLDVASFMTEDMHALTMDELQSLLEACDSEEVWMQFQDIVPDTPIGKVVLAVSRGKPVVLLYPPVDPADSSDSSDSSGSSCSIEADCLLDCSEEK